MSRVSRRRFLQAGALGVTAAALRVPHRCLAIESAALPAEGSRAPVPSPHFPSALHAFVWRNWQLVPVDRMAAVVGAEPAHIKALGAAMGLGEPPRILADEQRRSYLSVIRRNWHLLPYQQLLALLNWDADQLAFTLREDDFLWIKLGGHKPKCPPVKFAAGDEKTRAREREIAAVMAEVFPEGAASVSEPLFHFVRELSAPKPAAAKPKTDQPLRLCYSYFALYGDPLLEPELDPFPNGYLARLAEVGVNAVWLQGVLHKLAKCPWQPDRSARFEERLQALRGLTARAREHGIAIFLYLNEPRAVPISFAAAHPELKGVGEADFTALCTSTNEVQRYLRDAVAAVCRAVPDLGGFFSITASENLTNCWSHHKGGECPRCSKRGPAEVIAEVNADFARGIHDAGGSQRLIAWDWGWQDAWAADVIGRLPETVSLMSVSEWDLPIERGGVKSTVGEYSISSVGPGPRAKRHWKLARERGLRVIAKVQAANSWELSAVPYIPALHLVAEHAARLRDEKIDEVMLGWTLGGYPSPNLETMSAVLAGGTLDGVAKRRFGSAAAAVLRAWEKCSRAFREFPFHIRVVYRAPLQLGPANPLWLEPTGYPSTMVGYPYDDLAGWRNEYPPQVFASQLEKCADGFHKAAADLSNHAPREGAEALAEEAALIEAAAIHFASVANQARFVSAREAKDRAAMRRLLVAESELARRLHRLQSADSRIGYEASNHYYYVPLDCAEKVINCRHLLSEISRRDEAAPERKNPASA